MEAIVPRWRRPRRLRQCECGVVLYYILASKQNVTAPCKVAVVQKNLRSICTTVYIRGFDGCKNLSLPYGLVLRAADRSFHIRAYVCDPTKTIVKRSLQTLICSVVFRGSVKGSQRAGFSKIEYLRSYNEQ